ncbi:ParB/RepB/Spo0J family partition protein [Chryseobacterium sp. B21-037]|uniref:ParB/RepB/Spo0J family partition protein n=1 Tax=Chryseobacterium sp. B21-037 TaxID=2926038 RepID=UPI00235A13D9|nr:ParB/RepB/Spo0J family partition protein [Chryseobacterium sp. B21-037]MDC8105492.1 ParB/RepB/Spo0J family partition protein [Chryseobacterium sp. B21-037]
MSENNVKSLIDSFKPRPFIYMELPLEVIEGDPNQPRKAFGLGVGGDYDRLLKSIRHYGIEDPIKVSEVEEGRFLIMDGHRRFGCAKELKLKTVPCRVYPKMSDGEFEARRYEMQNNRRSWKPMEKANAIHKIKAEYSHASKKEIADLIGISQVHLFHFIELRDMRMEYLELMSEYNMKEYQRIAFMQLLPKLRKIKEYEIDDIVKVLFKKISDNVTYRASDFKDLSKIFVNASLHEEEILYFLTEPLMTVTELCESAKLSGFSSHIKILIKEFSTKKNSNIKLTEKEHELFEDLYNLMKTFE